MTTIYRVKVAFGDNQSLFFNAVARSQAEALKQAKQACGPFATYRIVEVTYTKPKAA